MKYPLFIISVNDIDKEELKKNYSFVKPYRTSSFSLKIRPERIEKKLFNDIKQAGKCIRKKEKINANLLAIIAYTNDNWFFSKHGQRDMQIEFYKRKNNSSTSSQ